MTDIIQELRGLIAKATPGDLSTAELHAEAETVECPACHGEGEVEAAYYGNIDGVALGVQFYGIGEQFGAHEKLWTAVSAHLPALLDRLEAAEKCKERIAAMIDGSDGNIPFTTVFVPLIVGHNQPCMSGDMRDRLHPHQRRRFDDVCKTLATAIREVKP
jgi:hypothetical protein